MQVKQIKLEIKVCAVISLLYLTLPFQYLTQRTLFKYFPLAHYPCPSILSRQQKNSGTLMLDFVQDPQHFFFPSVFTLKERSACTQSILVS